MMFPFYKNMIISGLLIFLFLLPVISCETGNEPEREDNESSFEIILYDNLAESVREDVTRNLSENYKRILSDLNVKQMPFVTVKVWGNYSSFMDAMEQDLGVRYSGATGYVFGMTEVRIFYNNRVAIAAVHEYAHLVSMQVNSSIPNNPRWLWEAVALFENKEFVDPASLSYMISANYPTLQELNTDYNSSNHNIYSVGYVLLEFIISKWGKESVIELIKNNGNIHKLFGLTASEFEADWYRFIKLKYLN